MTIAWIGLTLAGAVFLAEIVVSAAVGRPLHRWADSLSALGLSALTGLVSHFGKAFLFLMYVPIYAAVPHREWTGSLLDWTLAVLSYEFFAYWFHRFSHRTTLGWCVHVTHHQSEELNLSTALRTAPLRSLLDWPTLLPMAVLGVPPHVLVLLYVQHVAGQFWLHVQWLRHLGPLEWVLNTPSHHRVHHGCDVGYQDANYGASLILWDRLFGTFVPEAEAPTYGVTRPVPGWDPFRATFYPFVDVWRTSRGWSAADRLQVWLRPPGWTPAQPDAPRGSPPPRREAARPRRLPEAIWQLFAASLLLLAVPNFPDQPLAQHAAWIGLGLWSLAAFGAALEDRPVQRWAHLAHAGALLACAGAFPDPGGIVWVGLAAGSLALGVMAAPAPRPAAA